MRWCDDAISSEKLVTGLNKQQQKAVKATDGPLLLWQEQEVVRRVC